MMLTACIPIGGDGAIRISGGIIYENGNERANCNLRLSEFRSGILVGDRVISGEFVETFVIPPIQASYIAMISCAGGNSTYKSNKIFTNGFDYFEKPYSLGNIAI